MRIFEVLMVGALVLSIAAAPFNDRFYAAFAKFGPVILAAAVAVFGLTALVIWAIARRRKNWLRWTWLVFFVVTLPGSVPTWWRELHAHPVNGGLFFANALMQAAAFAFIFTGDARAWFQTGAQTEAIG